MMRPKWYQALIGGVIWTLGLVFLGFRLYVYYSRWNNDLGISIFDGHLPPVPQYQDTDSASQNPSTSDPELLKPLQDSTQEDIVDKPSVPRPTETGPTGEWSLAWNNKSIWPDWSSTSSTPNGATKSLPTHSISHEELYRYVHSIMHFNDEWPFERVSCPSGMGSRYDKLKGDRDGSGKARYFFALNLLDAADALPRLMSTIIETIKYLGPERCAISIVDGGSQDGTWEILTVIKSRIDDLGAQFFLATSRHSSDDAQSGQNATLADLRNQVLEPLKAKDVEPSHSLSSVYSSEAVVIFLDDIAVCPEDILELVFQHVNQGAQMTCAFDWVLNGTVFHDVWESRSLAGNTFFEVPHDGSLTHSNDMFFDDAPNKRRYKKFQPLQVYSCWGGMVTLNATSFAEDTVKFRTTEQTDSDCYMGESMLLAKDLFSQGLGKILAVPSVNVAYSDDEATETKQIRGYVSDHINHDLAELDAKEIVQWQRDPPELVKCLPLSEQVAWTEWIQSV
ncbi:hypothetical protein N7528_005821 [Penicillium herquei]|nr:hypothetical protein N7528_005821 [Penicillium herquei]